MSKSERRLWSEDDKAIILRMLNAGAGIKEIADHFPKRTRNAVVVWMSKRGLTSTANKQKAKLLAMYDALVEMTMNGEKDEAITIRSLKKRLGWKSISQTSRYLNRLATMGMLYSERTAGGHLRTQHIYAKPNRWELE